MIRRNDKRNQLEGKRKKYGKDTNRIIYRLKNWWQDESGMGVVEVVLIIIVLIGLVILFKDNITALVESLFETVVDDAGTLQ